MAIVIRIQSEEADKEISEFLDFKPNDDQRTALNQIKTFINDKESKVFVLSGAAGTGKTSIMKAVISYINSYLGNFQLLAPTGRAANIIGKKSNFNSSTIHSHIYNISEVKDQSGKVIKLRFHRKKNEKSYKEVFFVDESSMISEKPGESDSFISENSLLHDFMGYVKAGNVDNKVIFIGDKFQLPPVDSNESRALDVQYLSGEFNVKVNSFELKQVMRQSNESYILDNAHLIKESIINKKIIPELNYCDIVNSDNKIDKYVNDIKSKGFSNSIVLAWKNKVIEDINNEVRKLLYADSQKQINIGEHLILSSSYYSKDRYIANGSFVKVIEIIGGVEIIGETKFIKVRLINTDNNEELSGTYIVNLDYLENGHESINAESKNVLWRERYKVNRDLQVSKNKKDDEYLSALELRYAYAVTVHKSQGGEWDNVYLFPEVPNTNDSKRLLYTAVTRAKKELINFDKY